MPANMWWLALRDSWHDPQEVSLCAHVSVAFGQRLLPIEITLTTAPEKGGCDASFGEIFVFDHGLSSPGRNRAVAKGLGMSAVRSRGLEWRRASASSSSRARSRTPGTRRGARPPGGPTSHRPRPLPRSRLRPASGAGPGAGALASSSVSFASHRLYTRRHGGASGSHVAGEPTTRHLIEPQGTKRCNCHIGRGIRPTEGVAGHPFGTMSDAGIVRALCEQERSE